MDLLFVIVIILYVSIRMFLFRRETNKLEIRIERLEAYKLASYEFLEKVTEGIDPEKINRVVLSTTLTTNAIVQGNIPPVGMIVSGGPGIVPEDFAVATESIDESLDLVAICEP